MRKFEQLELGLFFQSASNATRSEPPKYYQHPTSSKETTSHLFGEWSSYSHDILESTWISLIKRFFPEANRLYEYDCKWSTRLQKRTLASCNLQRKRIVVAQELNDPLFYRTLSPLLYHEMCHAFLEDNISKKRGKLQWHGPEFKRLEERHPEIPWLDLWIKEGGWRYAVARHRARRRHLRK
jgi:hypothetical protein